MPDTIGVTALKLPLAKPHVRSAAMNKTYQLKHVHTASYCRLCNQESWTKTHMQLSLHTYSSGRINIHHTQNSDPTNRAMGAGNLSYTP